MVMFKNGFSLALGSGKQKRVFIATLFTVSLLLSLIVQLPLSWLVSQPQVKSLIEAKISPSQQLKISSSRGTIWKGELDLMLVSNTSANTSVGSIHFDLNLLPLLWANLSADIHWQLANSSLNGTIGTNLLSTNENRTIKWQTSQGQIQLKELLAKLNIQKLAQSPVVQNLTGLIEVKQLAFDYAPQSRWFNVFQASLQLDGFNVMNNAFPAIQLKSDLQDKQLITQLSSEDKNWQLTGKASLTSLKRYQLDLSVKANDASSLPDWAYLMNKKSTANYIAKFSGRL